MNSEAPHPFFFYLPSRGRSFISYPAGFWLLLVRKSMGSCWEGRGGVGVGDRASVPTCRSAMTLRASVHAVMGSLDPTLWFTEWLMGSCWVWPLSSAGRKTESERQVASAEWLEGRRAQGGNASYLVELKTPPSQSTGSYCSQNGSEQLSLTVSSHMLWFLDTWLS